MTLKDKSEREPPYLYVITIKLSKKEATRTPDLFLLIKFMQIFGETLMFDQHINLKQNGLKIETSFAWTISSNSKVPSKDIIASIPKLKPV